MPLNNLHFTCRLHAVGGAERRAHPCDNQGPSTDVLPAGAPRSDGQHTPRKENAARMGVSLFRMSERNFPN